MPSARSGTRYPREIDVGEDAAGPFVIVWPAERTIHNAPTTDELARTHRTCAQCGKTKHVRQFRIPLTAAQSSDRGKNAGVLATRDSDTCRSCHGVNRVTGKTAAQLHKDVFDGRVHPSRAKLAIERRERRTRLARQRGLNDHYERLRRAPWDHARKAVQEQLVLARARMAAQRHLKGAADIASLRSIWGRLVDLLVRMRSYVDSELVRGTPAPGFADEKGRPLIDQGNPDIMAWHHLLPADERHELHAVQDAWLALPGVVRARVRVVPPLLSAAHFPETGPLFGFIPLATKPRLAQARAMRQHAEHDQGDNPEV